MPQPIKNSMPYFTIRVELETDNQNDYILLADQLIHFNMYTFIESEDGKPYYLPTGEFRLQGDFTLQQVLDRTILATKQFLKNCKILVTESNGTAWTGLTNIN